MKINILYIGIFLCFHAYIFPSFKQVSYSFSKELPDVVIPCHEKDVRTLGYAIKGILEHIAHRRIIIVSAKDLRQDIEKIDTIKGLYEKVEWFNEREYPFSKEDIAYEIFQDKTAADYFINHPHTRIGWIYQQFLKLYAPFVIPNISSNVLIVDADTIFLKKVTFQEKDGSPLFCFSGEYVSAYFDCIKRLVPTVKKVFPRYSGICHHMLFQKPVLEDLFLLIESMHNEEAWKAICHAIDQQEIYRSCFSEYELYFNYIFLRTRQAKIRSLKWISMPWRDFTPTSKQELDYVSCHAWM